MRAYEWVVKPHAGSSTLFVSEISDFRARSKMHAIMLNLVHFRRKQILACLRLQESTCCKVLLVFISLVHTI